MSYDVTYEVSLTFPAERLENVAAIALEVAKEAEAPPRVVYLTDNKQVLISRCLNHVFGRTCDGDISMTGLDVGVDDPCYYLTGTTWFGQQDEEIRPILQKLANVGVTGTVDGEGEDGAHWRWRLLDNGEVRHYIGEVVYPLDEAEGN